MVGDIDAWQAASWLAFQIAHEEFSRLITIASLLIGCLLFAFVIRQSGWQELSARVREAGAGLIWLLVISGLRPVARALAWRRCLPIEDQQIGFWTVWRARLVGDAVGNVAAAGPLLAEPARLLVLGGRVPLASAASSLSIELLIYFASCCVVMIVGLALLLDRLTAGSPLRRLSFLALAGLVIIVVTLSIGIHRRWSLVGMVERLSQGFRLRHHRMAEAMIWLERKLQKLRALETEVFDFFRHRPRDFAMVCGCEAAFHLLSVAEIVIALRLARVQTSLASAFIFEAVNRLITMLFAFVPARVGVDEASSGLVAGALGLAAVTGVTIAVYRKLRVLFWTAVGGLLLALSHARFAPNR